MSRIRAVLFDLDGVLIDSRLAKWAAAEYALTEHGVKTDRAAMTPHMHKLSYVHKHLASHVPYDAFLASYDQKLEELKHTIVLYEGTEQTLRALHQQGYKLAVVSSSRAAHALLKKWNLLDLFDAVITAKDTKVHKPHPEPILLALQRLNVRPVEAAMVGDLPADIQSAQAAGLALTIALTHGFAPEALLRGARPARIMRSLGELPSAIAEIQTHD